MNITNLLLKESKRFGETTNIRPSYVSMSSETLNVIMEELRIIQIPDIGGGPRPCIHGLLISIDENLRRNEFSFKGLHSHIDELKIYAEKYFNSNSTFHK